MVLTEVMRSDMSQANSKGTKLSTLILPARDLLTLLTQIMMPVELGLFLSLTCTPRELCLQSVDQATQFLPDMGTNHEIQFASWCCKGCKVGQIMVWQAMEEQELRDTLASASGGPASKIFLCNQG